MKKSQILHISFIIGILFKGIDGFWELIGGLFLVFAKSGSIPIIIQTVFQHELSQDPTDLIANYLINLSQTMSLNTLSFAAIYLIIHGSIKLGLFLGLWLKKIWAYPLATILLSLFMVYQLIRLSYTHSFLLLFLTLIDIIIIFLLKSEYKRLKNSLDKKD